MLLLQLSAAQAPAECALAVAKALALLQREALARDAGLQTLEAEPGRSPMAGARSCWRSTATLPRHSRGAGAERCRGSARAPIGRRTGAGTGSSADARSSCRQPATTAPCASKPCARQAPAASAVRAAHLASGISVKVQSERSQLANKRLALALIRQRLAEQAKAVAAGQRTDRHQVHRAIDRGNAQRTFRGAAFIPDAD